MNESSQQPHIFKSDGYKEIAYEIFVLSGSSVFLGGCAIQPEKVNLGSGFIPSEYASKLVSVKTGGGQKVFRYVKPDVHWKKYHSAIIEPVVAYPRPEPTEKVSGKTLKQIQARLTGVVKKLFSRFLLITGQKGTDVLRVQTAISGINISNKQLAPYELVPFALLRAGVKTAIGERDQEVRLYLESKISDSDSGELLFVGIRELTGEDLENAKARLTIGTLEKSIRKAEIELVDMMGSAFRDMMPER